MIRILLLRLAAVARVLAGLLRRRVTLSACGFVCGALALGMVWPSCHRRPSPSGDLVASAAFVAERLVMSVC